MLVLFAGACEERRATVDVSFGESLEGLLGFSCVQDANPGVPLIARAVAPDGNSFLEVNLVVDLIEMGDGIPSCRPTQIRAWCATHDCHASEGRRVIQPFDELAGIDPGTEATQDEVLQALANLDGNRIFSDVPSGKALILRVVGTIQPMASLDDTVTSGRYALFDTAGLLGVAYSCPVVLSAASGELFLGFDALTTQCESGVIVASGSF